MVRIVRRGRGRPRGTAPGGRERILDIAASQIASQRSVRLSLRELTRAAGVTPALLHYYFEDLDGLVATLVRERAEPGLRTLREELLARPAGAAAALSRFLQKWSGVVARQPWLLPCLLRPPDESPPDALGTALRLVITEAQSDGAVRADLPSDYIALLLMMLGSLPQYCATQLGAGLQLSAEPGAVTQLTLLNLSLLQRGIAARL
jgi:AcrR family transcriptional regulator